VGAGEGEFFADGVGSIFQGGGGEGRVATWCISMVGELMVGIGYLE
jgi:hypothetical protein